MKKLKTPLWLELIYFILIAVGPAVIVALELFQSHSSVFKWTFASLGSLLLLLIIVKKFILNNMITKVEQKITLLEHDFSIGVGNRQKIFTYWKQYTILLASYRMILTLLSSVLAWVFITALSEGLIKFRGAMSFILLFVVIAITFRIVAHLSLRCRDEQ